MMAEVEKKLSVQCSNFSLGAVGTTEVLKTNVEGAETKGKKDINGNRNVVATTSLENKIIRQIEFYFGDINLPRDKFLQKEIKKDDGWVSMKTMLLFRLLAKLSRNTQVIAEAIKKSPRKLVEVSEDGSKIRRSPSKPLPERCGDLGEETLKRSIFCKGFPKTEVLEDLLDFFEAYGPIDKLVFLDDFCPLEQQYKFRGSVYVIFATREKAEDFLYLENVMYKDKVLTREWNVKQEVGWSRTINEWH